MSNKTLQALYGMKWNPFLPDVPSEALFESPRLASFRERVHHLTTSGGYALLSGDPGTGKSGALRILHSSLSRLSDVIVGVLTRPQSSVFDFYRELGELFGVGLTPTNRWGGTKALRDRWIGHVERTGICPILLIDEAQEMRPDVLSEIRLLASYLLDSKLLLLVILAGDDRILDRLRSPELLSLGTRIRVRLELSMQTPNELREVLDHLIAEAGGSVVFSEEVANLLATHAGGNLRSMMNLGAELLDAGVQRQARQIDEKLFFERFGELGNEKPRKRAR